MLHLNADWTFGSNDKRLIKKKKTAPKNLDAFILTIQLDTVFSQIPHFHIEAKIYVSARYIVRLIQSPTSVMEDTV